MRLAKPWAQLTAVVITALFAATLLPHTAHGVAHAVRRDDDPCSTTFKGARVAFTSCTAPFGEKQLQLFWTLDEGVGTLNTLFRVPSDGGYVAFAWGAEQMVGSHVVVAFLDARGAATAAAYRLAGKSTSAVQPASAAAVGLDAVAADVDDRVLGARFSRRLPASDALPQLAPADGSLPAIWAVGPRPRSATQLAEHDSGARGVVRIDLRARGLVTVDEGYDPRFRAHGVAMTISWGLLAPTAILTMRYFKKLNPAAFRAHQALNSVAAIVTIAAAIGVAFRASHTFTRHMVFGYSVVALATLQIVGGLARPAKDRSTRRVWYTLHSALGWVVYCFGILNCFFGVSALNDSVSWYIVLAASLSLYALLYLFYGLQPQKYPVYEPQRLPGGESVPAVERYEEGR